MAVAGLKDVTTGETLCDEKAPILLERMEFPDPVIKASRDRRLYRTPVCGGCARRYGCACKSAADHAGMHAAPRVTQGEPLQLLHMG